MYLSLGSLVFEHKSIIRSIQIIPPVVYSLFGLLYLLYPLAGCLADIRCGRYKTVIGSLWFIAGSGLVVFTCIAILIVVYTSFGVPYQAKVVLIIAVGLIALLGLIVLCSSWITYDANVIQFGMDQLHDSPAEDSVLFIHWFVFCTSLGSAITKIPSRWITDKCWESILVFASLALILPIILGTSLCFIRQRRQWFIIDSGSRNPYKLVYKVIKFAAQHKIPIHRSAFTYCEDELPSRMDLAKEKYGGPFTTEQVEDVKAFLGILCILITLGPMFTVDTAVNHLLNTVPHHFTVNESCTAMNYLIQLFELGDLSSSFVIILIPSYICLLRPFIRRYIPGMLKRLGLGMILMSISLFCTLLIDTMGHVHHSHKVCFRKTDTRPEPSDSSIDATTAYYTVTFILNGLVKMLFYVAAYEFICAQSPHAMKGLLIGTFYTIKGVFQLIGALVIFVPFYTYRLTTNLPSCGFVYYLVNIVVAVICLVAYTWVAKRYQYRQRDEPDNTYRYAEEYYDKTLE
jgi:peptide/histidine transporter 3/4